MKIHLRKIKDKYMPTTSLSVAICASKLIDEHQLQFVMKKYPEAEFIIKEKHEHDEIYNDTLEIDYDESSGQWTAKIQGKDQTYELYNRSYKKLCQAVMQIQSEELGKLYKQHKFARKD